MTENFRAITRTDYYRIHRIARIEQYFRLKNPCYYADTLTQQMAAYAEAINAKVNYMTIGRIVASIKTF